MTVDEAERLGAEQADARYAREGGDETEWPSVLPGAPDEYSVRKRHGDAAAAAYCRAWTARLRERSAAADAAFAVAQGR